MRRQVRSTAAVLVLLIVLLGVAGCGRREESEQGSSYPAPSPPAALSTAYPQSGIGPTAIVQQPGPTVVGSSPPPVFGIVVDDQMRIVYVEPGRGAEQGGLRAGDLLKSIAGVDVRPEDPATLQESRAAAMAAQQASSEAAVAVPFVVERNGTELLLSVAPAQPAPAAPQTQPPPTATPVVPPFDYF